MARRARAPGGPAPLAMVALALAVLVSTCSPPTRLFASALAGPPAVVVGDTAACESCLVFAHILYDAVGDPYVESKLADYLIASICPNFDDKESCKANVNNLVEALVEWMRANLEPEDLCHQYGLCAAREAAAAVRPRPAAAALPDRLLRALSASAAPSSLSSSAPPSTTISTATTNGPKDVTCPLCMFVLTKIKDALSDPITREKVHDAGMQACASLPGGDAAKGIRDVCVDFVERNEAQILDLIDRTEPADLCLELKACAPAPSSFSEGEAAIAMAAAMGRRWLGLLLRPELSSLPAAGAGSDRISSPALASLALHVREPLSRLSDGNCDACMAVVRDVHRAVASPSLQDQATELAKEACDFASSATGSAGEDLAGRCKAGVDQYAPLVFGMALAYLQPATLCAQVHLCPAPSSGSASARELEAGGWSRAGLLPPPAPVGAARLVEAARAVAAEVELSLERALRDVQMSLGGAVEVEANGQQQQQRWGQTGRLRQEEEGPAVAAS